MDDDLIGHRKESINVLRKEVAMALGMLDTLMLVARRGSFGDFGVINNDFFVVFLHGNRHLVGTDGTQEFPYGLELAVLKRFQGHCLGGLQG